MHIQKQIFISLLLLIFSNVPAQAANKEVESLMQQGAFNKALDKVELSLKDNPEDVQSQFLKGLILAQLDRLKEAESVFVNLTEQHPELPEPYNNLAVIYAATGEFDKAEDALRKAINTHPSYATAHENLGDIYAKMATQAYNQALKLDSASASTKQKLSLISHLFPVPGSDYVNTTEETKQAPEQVAVKETPKPEPVAEVKTEKKPEEPEAEPILAKLDTEPTTLIEPPFDKNMARKEIQSAVNSWANAWSAKDVKRYVGSYSPKFVPPKGLSRKEWQQQRQVRLAKPRYIKVSLKSVNIEVLSEDLAMVRFKQHYQSDTYQDQVNKVLLMNKVDGSWLISKEQSN